jgi:type I restriction enzyme R subunit
MSVGERERITQNRIIGLFRDKLNYTYLGDRTEYDNTNIEEDKLAPIFRKGLLGGTYSPCRPTLLSPLPC